MGYILTPFADVGPRGLSDALLLSLIAHHEGVSLPRFRRLWAYYRNPVTRLSPRPGSRLAKPYRLGQEQGLPHRFRDEPAPLPGDGPRADKEVVIENDIAWRLHTMIEFMFGRPLRFVSLADDPRTRSRIEAALDRVWEASGGIALLQDLALLAHVYGHVDLIVRPAPASPIHQPGADPADPAAAARIEAVEPTRGLALLNPDDFRIIDAYILHYQRESAAVEPAPSGFARPIRRFLGRGADPGADDLPGARRRRLETVTEILSPRHWQRYQGDFDAAGPGAMRLVGEGPNTIAPGIVPVVHIQNQSQPFAFEGLGEVEPLIPLQDELNTRLSDRASRVTMQSFKMYLCKGIDGVDRAPVGPGTVWSTDNPAASIDAFGGDAASPSEDRHIEELREALDKASGVPPLATGVVQGKVGNLTSENALRITLAGLLSRTARKRVTYGRGLAQVCRLVLTALHHAGVLQTAEHDRLVRIDWPDPLEPDTAQRLIEAKAKRDLGVPAATVLKELGYAAGPDADPGVE
ncbi:MAG: phage portal protein [Phycisphaeraceae bacterium]|nr:phage portal protein [Phycisphaeraceae bacterium]